MKIVVIHPDAQAREEITNWLEEKNHAVMAAEPQLTSWPALLAEHEPDLVLLAEPLDRVELTIAQTSFPDCQFRVLGENREDWGAVLQAAEEAYESRRTQCRRYTERRLIVHDAAYLRFSSGEKLHRPKREPGWEEVAVRQEALFVMQLQTGAAGGHQRAKRYFSILRRSHRRLLEECAYRIGHSSYKIAWLREDIGRWLSVLCHYLPDAEISACPQPQNASAEFVFLHHEMPATYLYPIICVLRYGVRPSIAEQLKRATTWNFAGQSEAELAEAGCMLLGVNAYLAELARTQVWCMEQFLAANSEFHRQSVVDRGLHRAIGATLEFWGWHYLLGMGNDLREITSRVLTGETRVERREGDRLVPTFREFKAAMSTAPESASGDSETDLRRAE